MKNILIKVAFVWQALTMFICLLWLSLVPMINNEHFYQQIWEENEIYQELDLSEEELTKVINKTMDYLWGKEDELQLIVTHTNGKTEEFYHNWGVTRDGKIMDELAHMKDCRVLFISGKYIALSSLIILVLSTVFLIYNHKEIKSKDLRVFFITNILIIILIGLFAIAVVQNFDEAFTIFHQIFFSNSNVSWTYPAFSNMIIMLPEDELFAKIVYNTITCFGILFVLENIIYILLSKLYFKKKEKLS